MTPCGNVGISWQIFSFCKKNQNSGFLSKTQHPNFKCWLKKKKSRDSPGSTVDKDLPAKAGDVGSISAPRRFRMPPSTKPVMCHYWALVQQLLKPECLKPTFHKRSHHTAVRSPCTTMKSGPCSPLETARAQQQRPSATESKQINSLIFKKISVGHREGE